MGSICHTPIGGRTVRVTRISTLGSPVTGSCAQVTSSGWTSVAMDDDVDTPDTFDIRVGAGITCLPVRSRPLLNWVTVTVDFCQVDPDLLTFVNGATVIDDGVGDSAGWAADTDTYGTGSFALELWTGIAGTAGCTTIGARYGYLLLPWLAGGVFGDVTHKQGTTSFRVKAATVAGSRWGVGPYNVVLNGSGTPSPLLAAIPPTRHRHWQVTQVAPPAGGCGCQPL